MSRSQDDFSGYANKLEQEVTHLFSLYREFIMSREKDGLTHVQAVMMRHLFVNGPSTVSDIADFMGVTMAAVSSLTDRLVKNGLITRERSETDRRVVMVSLTPGGHEEIQRFMDLRREKIKTLLKVMGEENVLALLQVVSDISKGLEACLSGEV